MGMWIVEADDPDDEPVMVIENNPDGTVSVSMPKVRPNLRVATIERMVLKLGAAGAQAINAKRPEDGVHEESPGGDDRA